MAIFNTDSTLPVLGAVQPAVPASPLSSDPMFGWGYSYRQADTANPTTAAVGKLFPSPGTIADYDFHPSASYQYSGSQSAPTPPIGYPQPPLPTIPRWQPQWNPSHLLMEPQSGSPKGYPNPLQPQTLADQSTSSRKPTRKKHKLLSTVERQRIIKEIEDQPVVGKARYGTNQKLIDKYNVSYRTITRLRRQIREEELNPSPDTGHSELSQPLNPGRSKRHNAG